MPTTPLHPIAPGVWVLAYPLKVMGVDLRRNVTILRLTSGKLVIHSTAPFTPEDVAAITALGEPGWLVDTLLRHDTFARDGRAAFPDLPYLAPEGFSRELDFPTGSLLPAPEEWAGELEVIRVAGAPLMEEHVFFHPASRTLIVADLIFSFTGDQSLWAELLLKAVSVGGRHSLAMTRLFKMSVQDEAAFDASIAEILTRDFDRIIVGHGDIVETNGRALLEDAIREADFEPEAQKP